MEQTNPNLIGIKFGILWENSYHGTGQFTSGKNLKIKLNKN